MVRSIMTTSAFNRMVEVDTINLPEEYKDSEQHRLNLIVNGNPYHMIEPERIIALQNPKVATRIMLAAEKESRKDYKLAGSISNMIMKDVAKNKQQRVTRQEDTGLAPKTKVNGQINRKKAPATKDLPPIKEEEE